MWAIAIRLLIGGLSWLREGATAVWGLIRTYPLQTALIASLCLSAWLWRARDKAMDLVAARNGEIAALHQASDQARAAAEAQREAVEAHYTQLAKDSDNAHARELAQANDALDRFIASHRLRGSVQAGVSPTTPGAAGNDPGVDAGLPGSGIVVAEADLRICAARTADAIASQAWAQSLIAQGLAIPAR